MNEIYYVGYGGSHFADFKYDIPEGFNCYVLIITTTPALFRVHGNVHEYPAHTAILYPPNHEIWYSANGAIYGNHWLHFATDESFVTNFPKQAVPFSISDPEYCQSLFQLLTWETSHLVAMDRCFQNTGIITQSRDAHLKHAKTNSEQSNMIIAQILRILFNKLYSDLMNTTTSNHDHELLSLRRRIATHPQLPWNISDMAKELHISIGYLQLLYKQKFNVSCMDDVINFRLFKARDLLIYTTESISDIAEQCGYNNTEHFCRQFRKVIGTTPGKFRKNYNK